MEDFSEIAYVLLQLINGVEKWDLRNFSLKARTSRKDLASSSSGCAGAGLSEREGATEAMDGTRLGAILIL